jgi:hypothetical protein
MSYQRGLIEISKTNFSQKSFDHRYHLQNFFIAIGNSYFHNASELRKKRADKSELFFHTFCDITFFLENELKKCRVL